MAPAVWTAQVEDVERVGQVTQSSSASGFLDIVSLLVLPAYPLSRPGLHFRSRLSWTGLLWVAE